MKEIKIFNNPEFGEIRATTIEGEPWFVGKDVAEILGYKDTSDALKKHVDEEDKGVGKLPTPGGIQNVIMINESGLYSLILSSKLPKAKEFKHWVTSEILPSIRKNGMYMTDQKAYDLLHNSGSLADMLQQAAEQLRQKDIEIKRMKPKELFADAVATSHTSILIGELAKILKQNGVEIGQNRLFAWMRKEGYLIKSGSSRNMPSQMSMELGLFEIKERTVSNPDGSVRITKTPKVTGKGQQYFVNKLLGINVDLLEKEEG